MRKAAAKEGPLWLHFDLVDARARQFLLALPALPPPARAALVEAEEATRIDAASGAIFGCLPDSHYEAEHASAPPVGLLHFALTEGLLVTARRHPLRGVHAALQTPSALTAEEALGSVLRHALAEFALGIATLAASMARIEDRLLRPGDDPPREQLAAVRRDALRLSRHLDPLVEALDDLAEDTPPPAALAVPLLREARRARTAVRALTAVLERGRIAQDHAAARAAEETNRRLLVLSVISAAMLPASLVAGIFGMNVGGVPGVEAPGGFAMAMSLIGASVVGVLVALRLWRLV